MDERHETLTGRGPRRMAGGYFMIGKHIPWNVPSEAIKRYLELSSQLAYGL